MRTQRVLRSASWTAVRNGMPPGASDARILKAIADGRNRISAAVERKLLRAPGDPVRLVDADFNHQVRGLRRPIDFDALLPYLEATGTRPHSRSLF